MTGGASSFGIDEFQAAQLAIEDAGELEGHAFELVPGNDQGTGDGGATVAEKFVADPTIVAVVGHSFSEPTSSAMPIYASRFIPIMSPSSTRADLSQQGNPSFNRILLSDKSQADLGAAFISENLDAKSVAIIHDGTPYGQGLAEGISDGLRAVGINILVFEAITPGKTDYSEVLTKIAAMKPDAVFYSGYQPEAAVLASQKNVVGLSRVPFISGDGVFGSQFLDLAKSNAEGYYVIHQEDIPSSDNRARFDEAYKAEYGTEAGSLSGYTWLAYDAAMTLIQAVKKVAISSGNTLYIPRKALVEAVRGTKHFAGLTGIITCDTNGDCPTSSPFVVYQIQNGRFVQLPAIYQP
jgi:branched-chain amino acid transport system substrate-binding protein